MMRISAQEILVCGVAQSDSAKGGRRCLRFPRRVGSNHYGRMVTLPARRGLISIRRSFNCLIIPKRQTL